MEADVGGKGRRDWQKRRRRGSGMREMQRLRTRKASQFKRRPKLGGRIWNRRLCGSDDLVKLLESRVTVTTVKVWVGRAARCCGQHAETLGGQAGGFNWRTEGRGGT